MPLYCHYLKGCRPRRQVILADGEFSIEGGFIREWILIINGIAPYLHLLAYYFATEDYNREYKKIGKE